LSLPFADLAGPRVEQTQFAADGRGDFESCHFAALLFGGDQETALSAQVTGIEGNVTALVATAANIQNTVNGTKTIADQLALDTQNLLAKWGTLDAPALKAQLDSLATQMGTPAQAGDLQAKFATLNTALTTIQTDMAKDATVAKNADVQNALAALTAIQTDMAKNTDLQAALGQLTTLQTSLTALSTQVGAPAQAVDVKNALTQLTSLQGSVTALQNAVGAPAQANALTVVQTQVSALETALTTLSGTQGMTMDDKQSNSMGIRILSLSQ